MDAAERFKLTQVLRTALTRVQDDWGISIPLEHLQRMNEYRPNPREAFAFSAYTSPRVELQYIFELADQPGLKGKLKFVQQASIPPLEQVQARYRVSDARLMPMYYLLRFGNGLRKVGLSALSVVMRTLGLSGSSRHGM